MTKRLEEMVKEANSLKDENKELKVKVEDGNRELRVLKEKEKYLETKEAKLKVEKTKVKRGWHEVEVEKAKIKVQIILARDLCHAYVHIMNISRQQIETYIHECM